MVGAIVKLAGRTVLPFNGQQGYVKAVTGDRWVVIVTLSDGSRQEIAVSPEDAQIVAPAPKLPSK